MIDWQYVTAAVWRSHRETLHAIHHVDPVSMAQLVGIDEQKRHLQANTERFLQGLPANNALLWGARGTGKSSLIKALLNQYAGQGLRVVEIDKNDMIYLSEIVDEIRDVDKHFVVYCDDLSFDSSEMQYKSLKRVLEGSIELPPKNVLIYATSNRRHLMPEFMQDNLGTKLVGEELHYTDTVEEKIALSDRFGLWLSFYPFTMKDYLSIVEHYFADIDIEKTELREAAKEFAALRGAHSGRTAKQFYNSIVMLKVKG